MAATQRMQKELKDKYSKMKNNPNLSPIEYLRAQCLSRGASGIKGLGRYDHFSAFACGYVYVRVSVIGLS